MVKAIKRELETNPNQKHFNHVVWDVLVGRKYHLWGGVVRDPIIKQKYGGDGWVQDIDFLVSSF